MKTFILDIMKSFLEAERGEVANKKLFIVALMESDICPSSVYQQYCYSRVTTGRVRLIRTHLLARFCFELSGILNYNINLLSYP